MSNTEIVVVGAGVAGLSAALAVAGTGHDVTLVTKAELVESNTYHAPVSYTHLDVYKRQVSTR